jgi:hypothetical protein
MRTLRVAWLLSRPTGTGAATLVLPVVAFGVASALLLTVLGGAHAFFSWTDDDALPYQLLAVIALALLVVPLLSLGGSAARLSARRRDDRLATLRLLGASGAMVRTLTVLESTALAVIGAFAGLAIYAALVPLVALIPFRGSPLGMTELWLPPLAVAIVIVGVAVLAASSAVIGLRAVVISPLGVRTKQNPPRMHWMRAVIALVVIAATVIALQLLQVAGSMIVIAAILGIGFGGTLSILGLVGPLIIGAFARRQARRAQTPTRLIAARSILESPKAAWRQVSGVAMTSFMAVFAGVGIAMTGTAEAGGTDPEGMALLIDIRTGVIVTVVASFLMVACSVGVNQAAGILDRRDLYVSLDRLGMPVATMDAARRRAVFSPLRIVSIGSALCAAIVVFPLTGIALVTAPLTLVVIAGCLLVGFALVWLGMRATRPILGRVLTAGESL